MRFPSANAMNLTLLRGATAFGSLKLRITLGGVMALVLGIGINTALLSHRAETDTLTAYHDSGLGASQRAAALLGQRASDLQRGLAAFAGQIDADMVADDAALAQLLDGKRVLRGMFASVFIARLDGHVHALAREAGVQSTAFSVADRDYFRQTLAQKRPVVSSAVVSRVSGEPVIIFTQPLLDANGIYGVLCGSIDTGNRSFMADLVAAQGGDADALVAVTDQQGRVLAHRDPTRSMRPLSEDARFGEAFDTWLIRSSPSELKGLHLHGEVLSAASVPGAGWIVWETRSEAALLAPLHSARRDALTWAGALIVLLSAGLLAFLWRLFQPLRLLEQRAQHLFDGQLDAEAGWPDGANEIGRLGRVLRHVGAERAQLEAFNAQVLRQLGSVMSAAPVGIAFTRNERFELVSDEFCRLSGRREDELLGQPTSLVFVSNEDHRALQTQVQAVFQRGEPYDGEWQMLRADATRFWANLRCRPVDPQDTSAGAIWTVNDISERRAAHAELQWSATHDPLTRLANRHGFEVRAAQLVAAVPRLHPASIVFVDLDHFKPINDTAGHAAGDAMLRAVAAAMTLNVRTGDLVARLGGDEFALLLDHCSHEVAQQVAEHVCRAIAAITLPWNGRTLRVGASLGVASLSAETPDVAAWVQAADAACYAAKADGRGTVRTAPETALRLVGARSRSGG